MSFRISCFAKQCGVNKETIRFYEQKGLLHEPNRTSTGYRIYSKEDVRRVRFIKKMQNLGFSLNEIDKLLGVVDRDDVRCKDMFVFVSQKQQVVQKKIQDLKRINYLLEDLKGRCRDQNQLYYCPIIEILFD